MSDDSQFLTNEIAHEGATIVETVEIPDGDEMAEYDIEVKEAPIEKITEFEEREESGEDTEDLAQEVFDDYLVQPDGLDVSKLGSRTLDAIMRGIFRAWGASDSDIDAALEDRAGN